MPRAERELAAAATSRYNGCIYCASVHARFASHFSHRTGEVQRLLDEGVGARIDERWDAIIAAFFNWANRLMLSLGEPAAKA